MESLSDCGVIGHRMNSLLLPPRNLPRIIRPRKRANATTTTHRRRCPSGGMYYTTCRVATSLTVPNCGEGHKGSSQGNTKYLDPKTRRIGIRISQRTFTNSSSGARIPQKSFNQGTGKPGPQFFMQREA